MRNTLIAAAVLSALSLVSAPAMAERGDNARETAMMETNARNALPEIERRAARGDARAQRQLTSIRNILRRASEARDTREARNGFTNSRPVISTTRNTNTWSYAPNRAPVPPSRPSRGDPGTPHNLGSGTYRADDMHWYNPQTGRFEQGGSRSSNSQTGGYRPGTQRSNIFD